MTLVSDDCLAALLPAGTTRIRIARPFEGPTCGLIPLGRPVASLTTSGLHWDVADWPSSFGGRMSTSNRVEGWDVGAGTMDEAGEELVVTVTTSDPIVWTATVFEKGVGGRRER
jgi:thiamine pyrophosphokinase